MDGYYTSFCYERSQKRLNFVTGKATLRQAQDDTLRQAQDDTLRQALDDALRQTQDDTRSFTAILPNDRDKFS